MRLKYKKFTLIVTLGIMLIGFVTFSMCVPIFHKNDKKDEKAADGKASVTEISDKKILGDIQTLVEEYFSAKLRVDMEKLKTLVTNIDYVEQAKLVNDATWFVSEENFRCTVLQGLEEDSYRVYVRYDAKISTTDTAMPALNVLYVVKGEDGYRIFNEEMGEKLQAYITKLDESDLVKDLSKQVSEELSKVIESDDKVRAFYEMLESAQEDGENGEDSQDTTGENVVETPVPEK